MNIRLDSQFLLNSIQFSEELRPELEKVVQNKLEEYYKKGYKDAVSNYAVWRDGEQLVGVMARPLKTVLQEVDESSVPIVY